MFLLSSFSCAHKIVGANNDCRGLKKYVKDNWSYDKLNNYYIGDLLGIKGERFICIKDMPKSKIIKMFGNPNEEYPKKLIYYESPGCHENNNECQRAQFVFDKNGGLVHLSLILMVNQSH